MSKNNTEEVGTEVEMKPTIVTEDVAFEYRDIPVTVRLFTTVPDLVAEVGERAILDLYQKNYVTPRLVGSKVEALKDAGAEIPKFFDLTLPGVMTRYGSGTKSGGYGVKVEYINKILKAARIETPVKELAPELLEKAIVEAKKLQAAEEASLKEQEELFKSFATKESSDSEEETA